MAVTIYEQVFEDIKNNINKGIIKPGDMIPSESSLSKEYNASRMTIRKGLFLLTEGGYIYSVPGKGYIVCQPNKQKHILEFDEIDVISQNAVRSQLLEVNIIPATKELKKLLALDNNQKVIIIRRLFHSKKEPFAYDVKYLPFDKGKPIIEEIIEYANFPEIVASYTPIFSVRNELTISVKEAGEKEVEFLKVREGYPILVIEQRLYEDENKPAGWGQIFYRGEYCNLRAVSHI
ncbi:MAG: GntR family transcriptional regulator [Bacillota bacterium]